MSKTKLTHIINPVKTSASSDLNVAQPVTFETMRRAKLMSLDSLNINLVTTQYEEDKEIIPEYFHVTDNLQASVLDYSTFEKKRKLPLLKDILEKAFEFDQDADYIIYSNVDIGIMPHFYTYVLNKINNGFDAFVINRRTIADHYTLKTIDEAYSDFGKPHPGYDCFVFKKSLYSKFNLQNICIGAPYVGLALYLNMKLVSKKFEEVNEKHLTFHIGNDQVWKAKSNNPYKAFNEKEFDAIKKELSKTYNNVNEVISNAFPTIQKNDITPHNQSKSLITNLFSRKKRD